MTIYYVMNEKNPIDTLKPYADIKSARKGAMELMGKKNRKIGDTRELAIPEMVVFSYKTVKNGLGTKRYGYVIDIRDPATRRHLWFRWVPEDGNGDWPSINADGSLGKVRRL